MELHPVLEEQIKDEGVLSVGAVQSSSLNVLRAQHALLPVLQISASGHSTVLDKCYRIR